MRIGIYGGTFDPPHIGHQILAAEALEQAKLDLVYWVLTPDPPHKTTRMLAPLSDRLRMVELAIEANPRFVLSKVDIDRKPPHYAVDTMSLLKSYTPQNSFYYLMGMDSLNELLTWHTPGIFVKLCKGIIVMNRRGESTDITGLEQEIPDLARKIRILNAPTIDISSTDIRRRIKRGLQFRYFVPEKVAQYITTRKLYLA